MNKPVTSEEAIQTLEQIKKTQAEISKQSAKEYAPWIGWGLYVVIFYAPFDFVKPQIWGPISWLAAGIGTFITYRYFRKRHGKIHTSKRTPNYAWLLYGLWISGGAFLAGVLQSHFAYAWTVAGLVTGIPFILYGLKLKSEG